MGGMKLGMFPGQLQALRQRVLQIRNAERKRGNRRAFLGVAAGGLLGLSGGFTLGRRQRISSDDSVGRLVPDSNEVGRDVDRSVDVGPQVEELRRWATNEFSALLSAHTRYFRGLIGSGTQDDIAWSGAVRLAEAALHGRLVDPVTMATSLQMVERKTSPPVWVGVWFQLLRAKFR